MISPVNCFSVSHNFQSINKPQRNFYPTSATPVDTVSFKGQQINNLMSEFSKGITSEKLSPIQAFLRLSADVPTMDKLLTEILSVKERGVAFIESVVAQPREAGNFSRLLSDKVGSGSKNLLTFMFDSPYGLAYAEFTKQKFNSAKSVSELLQIRPDWRGDKLLEKHRALFGNEYFELGEVPIEISREHALSIADYLKPFMQGSAKSPRQINDFNIGGRTYGFEYFTDGRTDKNVFGITTPEGKKYILKMAQENLRSLDNPFALGTLAKIDSYMTLNKSRNSAPLLYYNHDKNFLIYEYVEHKAVSGDTRNLTNITQHIPDYKDLGLQFNDSVGTNNCFMLDSKSSEGLKSSFDVEKGIKAGEWVSVDNDHVTFANRLQPQVYEFHSYLPNAMQFCV